MTVPPQATEPHTETTEPNGHWPLPDLAARALGGAVLTANDESFAEKEHLIRPYPVLHQSATFGHRGQLYDGWETRRRREPGHDWAIVRLGAPGRVGGIVVDTAYFTGNYPPEVSVDACRLDGHPSLTDLEAADWHTLVPRSTAKGDSRNAYDVDFPGRVTHVRLNLHPDGGVARLRVHGTPVPDPDGFADLPLDLAALVNGGSILGASNAFYSNPVGAITPGLATSQADGWETARRREPGHEWLDIGLAGRGVVRVAELDTTHLKHNAPGWASIEAFDGDETFTLLPRTALVPDTPHRFVLDNDRPAVSVRLNIFPDGGMARVRLYGRLTAAALAGMRERFEAR
ncbi:allantoicase [Glycomyces harbinensis]|uniref:Probable allantoicase n=1 Tax=Glycomyces harbinensis TaxID=58114 RepID=A0A1G7BRM8_9ACTN|nr:allantoicase [Glycomyces harbinensis]SDE29016.1 allantoicase [Glycomyces harbinensis]